MPINDFKPFAYDAGASVVNQTTYAAAVALLQNGFQSGIAQKEYLNKVWRQSSIMASAIGLLINNTTGGDAIDDGTTPTLTGQIIAAIQIVAAGVAANAVTVNLTTASTTLNSTQRAASFIFFTGTLTANSTVIFPVGPQRWTVINNTTGAFTLTCKTAAGTGVPIGQGKADGIIADGTNVRYDLAEGVTAPPGDNSKTIATTEFVQTYGASIPVGATNINSNTLLDRGVYIVDTSAGPLTLTLPAIVGGAKPAITLIDAKATWQQNNVTLLMNGQTLYVNFSTFSTPLILNVADQQFTIFYDGANWRLV